MGATEANTASPGDDLQEELQAALADIEKMSAASPAAAATPGDDRGETDDSRSEKNAAPPQPESATGESTAADDASTTDVEAPQASPGDADTGEPAPANDEEASSPGEPGGAEPAEAAPQSSPDVDASDSAPATPETTQPSQESKLLADEEVAAELTKIERMSNEEAAAIPALDDGSEPEEGPATPDDQGASAADEPAPGSETQPGDEDFTATLAKAEQTVTNLEADLRELGVTKADAPDKPAKPEGSDSSDSKPPVDSKSQPEAAPATQQAVQKKMPSQTGEKPAESAAQNGPPEARGAAAPFAWPVVPPSKRISRAVDNGLDAVNQPFEQIDRRTRTLVGYVAATTLVVSILAMIFMPLVMPHRDAIAFLQEKKAALNTPPPSEEANEASAGDEQTP